MQYLYLIKCQQFYKIGIAADVSDRIRNLQTGNPFPLEVLATYGYDNVALVETVLHKRFANRRTRGEWFDFSDDDIETFKKECVYLQEHPPVLQFKDKSYNINILLKVVEAVLNMFLHRLIKYRWGSVGKGENQDYYEIRLPTSLWKHDNGVFVLVDRVGNAAVGKPK